MPDNTDVLARGQHSAKMVDLIPALRAFARSLAREPDRSDDLVQETLTKGISSFHLYREVEGSTLKSWLFTIMRNTFYNDCRKTRREAPASAEFIHDALAPVEGNQEWRIQVIEIEAAINALPPGQRQVLTLVAILGVSYEECARVCSCEVGTVKSRLNRARETLTKSLDPARRDVKSLSYRRSVFAPLQSDRESGAEVQRLRSIH